MEPALPLPLRLDVSHAPVAVDHTTVSESISLFLTSYAARTGTSNAATDDASTATGSTGGVVAAQLTRLMNGLAGKIDYDAFANLVSGLNPRDNDMEMDDEELPDETPIEVLDRAPAGEGAGDGVGTESFSKAQELEDGRTPNLDSSLLEDPLEQASPSKKSKKDKKDKKLKKESTA